MIVEGQRRDLLNSDADVARWLEQIGFGSATEVAAGDGLLLDQLMFYDRTKSHKRRWCSMALCGNRHKVAEFRKRRQSAAD